MIRWPKPALPRVMPWAVAAANGCDCDGRPLPILGRRYLVRLIRRVTPPVRVTARADRASGEHLKSRNLLAPGSEDQKRLVHEVWVVALARRETQPALAALVEPVQERDAAKTGKRLAQVGGNGSDGPLLVAGRRVSYNTHAVSVQPPTRSDPP